MEAGDITLLNGDVSKVAEAIALSRETLRTIRQNLVWAFGYNVVTIPVAALGLLNPVLAGAAMAFSSVSVMANSLRLRSKSRALAAASGNAYSASAREALAASRGPMVAMGAATLVLVAPLVVFTAIDRDWLGGGGGADGPHSGTAHNIAVGLSNWKVTPSASEAPAGTVTFAATHLEEAHAHDGAGATHDLAILQEAADGTYSLVARTPEIPMGATELLTVSLTAGDYLLACDIVEEAGGETIAHMQEGMTAEFRVLESG